MDSVIVSLKDAEAVDPWKDRRTDDNVVSPREAVFAVSCFAGRNVWSVTLKMRFVANVRPTSLDERNECR